MKNPVRIWTVALGAAALAISSAGVLAEELTLRTAAAGRQRVRAELTVAMADGKLTEQEREEILRLAKRMLPRNEENVVRLALNQTPVDDDTDSAASPESDKSTPEEIVGEAIRPNTGLGLIQADDGQPIEITPYDSQADKEKEEEKGSPFFEEDEIDDGYMSADEIVEFWPDTETFYDGLFSFYADGLRHISLTTSVNAFKGPMDLDHANGNFGYQFGINAAFPAVRRLGVGVQAGTSVVMSDLQGTSFTGSRIRTQNFTTVGLNHRVRIGARRLKWGFAFDWLHDEYYSSFSMGQWRIKAAYELTPWSEVGAWACIPNDGHTALLSDGQNPVYNEFEPIAQGNFYYQRCLDNGATTAVWLGLAGEPGEVVFGGDARLPISGRLSLFGNFNYILPSASGVAGQDEEMWNLSLGIEFTPVCGTNYCQNRRFGPFLPVANNGTFAIRRF